MDKPLATKTLTYTIHDYSSYSSTYLPENILEDKPKDHTSRWSSEANTPPQYLTLRLARPAVVTRITFGKFEKTHVCNLKRFRVLGVFSGGGGFSGQQHLRPMLLADTGLKNDSVPESFRLRHSVDGVNVAFEYLRIVPVQSWGPSFNFSVWFVALHGDDDPAVVEPAVRWHEQNRNHEAIRLCLKHFRQNDYADAFRFLQASTNVDLEDPRLTRLHDTLVSRADYDTAERLVNEAIDDGLFDDWINGQQPVARWSALIMPDDIIADEISPASPSPSSETMEDDDGGENDNDAAVPVQPGCRGGHQMVIDSSTQTLYLFGGWDGNRDMSDFWSYSVSAGKWRLISADTEADGGPSARSCHKMVVDAKNGHIFVLGRYLERGLRDHAENMKSDFFVYDIGSGRWTMITDDTRAMGGPALIFDHQMCVDCDARALYVFGGQSLGGSSGGSGGSPTSNGAADKVYSGLYEYHVPTNTWTKKRDDVPELRSRSSHSMLFHAGQRKLFVFGGQRKGNEYLNDFFSYNVDTDEVDVISTGSSLDSAIPAVGHTQRATIDQERCEIHVMTGLNKDKDRKSEPKVSNSFWVYNIIHDRWTCFYKNENNSYAYWNRMQSHEPRPRYAHQLVYDESSRVHYMFGGNPGGKQAKEARVRLGDFWQLRLDRPDRREVMRRCSIMLRKTKFAEVAQNNPNEAVKYLHGHLAPLVDHHDSAERREYQLLASELFKTESFPGGFRERSRLFDRLAEHFPENMTHPRGNLIDLVPYAGADAAMNAGY